MNATKTELKAHLRALNAEHKAKTDLLSIYEQGKQTAHRGGSVDDKPHYRKQNKVAAWLKGFADGQREIENQKLSRDVDKAGIAKLKAIVKQALQDG